MASLSETLELALRHHTGGRFQEAESLYRDVLARDPSNPDALHLFGMLARDAGQLARAAEYIARAIRENPRVPMFHNNLGTVQQALGQAQHAVESFERALALDAGYPESLINLGNALQDLGRFEDAVSRYRQALRLRPESAECWNNLGNALARVAQPSEAVTAFRRALELNPGYAEAHLNLSGVLRAQGDCEAAESACREAVRLKPMLAEAHANLGAVLLSEQRAAEAEQHCRRAVWLKPALAEAHANLSAALIDQKKFDEAAEPCQTALRLDLRLPEAHANLGEILIHQGHLDQALAAYERAIELRPDFAEPHNKRGYVLEQQGRFEEALSCYEGAIALKPDLAEAHSNRSMAWLRMGDFVRGWPEYEWRWQRKDIPKRPFLQPLWNGSPLADRTILLHAEQGLGDAIQFARYIPMVKRAGGRVLLECQRALLPLLSQFSDLPAVAAGDPLPAFDVHAPLLSLPGIFRTTLESIPAAAPYLDLNSRLVDRWRQELAAESRRRVGLVWTGNPAHAHDRDRSLDFAEYAPLARLRDCAFYSLQRGAHPAAGVLPVIELEEAANSIIETAAIMLNLDLVITVDTMAAHLAGALARPVWVLLHLAADWRWLRDRQDSPWYPTARLFRQQRRGDWRGVLARVAEALSP